MEKEKHDRFEPNSTLKNVSGAITTLVKCAPAPDQTEKPAGPPLKSIQPLIGAQNKQRSAEANSAERLSAKEEPLGKQDTYYVKKLQDVHKSVKKNTSLGRVADGLRLLFQPGAGELTLSPSS